MANPLPPDFPSAQLIQTPRPPLFRWPPLGKSCGTYSGVPFVASAISYVYPRRAPGDTALSLLNTFFQTPVSGKETHTGAHRRFVSKLRSSFRSFTCATAERTPRVATDETRFMQWTVKWYKPLLRTILGKAVTGVCVLSTLTQGTIKL
jgi:hypothetical protein